MTADELRAKFEAWYSQDFYAGTVPAPTWIEERNCYQMFTDHLAWNAYQAAHASRDAEVEALKRDAERYRFLRNDTEGNAEAAAIKHSYEDHWLRFGADLDGSIDASMREDEK